MIAPPLPGTERERRARAQAAAFARTRLVAWRDALAGVDAPDARGLSEVLQRFRFDAVCEPADHGRAGREALARFTLGGRAATGDATAAARPPPAQDDSLARLGAAAAGAAMRRDPVMAQAFAQIRLGAWAQARDVAVVPGLVARLQSLELGLAPDLASAPTLALGRATTFAKTVARRVRRGEIEGDDPLLWTTRPPTAVEPAPAAPLEDVVQGQVVVASADFAPFGPDRFAEYARACARSADPARAERLAFAAMGLRGGASSLQGRPKLAEAIEALQVARRPEPPRREEPGPVDEMAGEAFWSDLPREEMLTGKTPRAAAPLRPRQAPSASGDWRQEQAELVNRLGGEGFWDDISRDDMLAGKAPRAPAPLRPRQAPSASGDWRQEQAELVNRLGGEGFWDDISRDEMLAGKAPRAPAPLRPRQAPSASGDWRQEQAELVNQLGGEGFWDDISRDEMLAGARAQPRRSRQAPNVDEREIGSTWRTSLTSLMERIAGDTFWNELSRDELLNNKPARPQPAPRRAGRAERLLPDAQALGLVESIRRARRYGAADAASAILVQRGAALAAHPLTREAYARLMQRYAEQAVPADVGFADGPVALVAEAFMVGIGAPPCWAHIARGFPYTQAGLAANDPLAQNMMTALGFSARERARRSIAWFMSGAPELAAGDIRVDGSDLARPHLTLADATLTLSPDMTDSGDPALAWLVTLAVRCVAVARPGANFEDRRAYRDAFMAAFARWIALAETIRRAERPTTPRTIVGPAWFTTALAAPQADMTDSTPIVLELSARNLELCDAGPRRARFNLASRRFVDAQDRGVCLDEAIDGAALVVTDEASVALSCALRGKITLLVANDRAARRAPSVEGLTRVAPEQIDAAVAARLAARANLRR